MATGSISLSGLLGGAAGSIDVTSLISQLMSAASVPQQQLSDQLTNAQYATTIYQTVNTKSSALLTAAQAITDNNIFAATKATSSDSSVSVSSDGTAASGSVSFTVDSVAAAQVDTIMAGSNGNVMSGSPTGFAINGIAINPTATDAASVASAINLTPNVGVRATVIHTDQGDMLQIIGSKTGTANAFTLTAADGTSPLTTEFYNSPQVTAASNAQVTLSGGNTLTSSTNTFSGQIPGITFTVSQQTFSSVTVSVGNDTASITSKIQALVDAANTLHSEAANDTQQGSPLQGDDSLNEMLLSLGQSVSYGTTSGDSYTKYGIDIDKNGVISFDSAAFLAAYQSDPTSAQSAINGFAKSLSSTANNAVDPTYGSITVKLNELSDQESRLNASISTWTDRLSTLQDQLTSKYTAMETALASLGSQQNYLNTIFASINGTGSGSGSNSKSG